MKRVGTSILRETPTPTPPPTRSPRRHERYTLNCEEPDFSDMQRDCLTPAEAGVGEEPDERPVVVRAPSEQLDLLMAEVGVPLTVLARQVHAAGRVRAEASIPNCRVEDRCEHAIGTDDAGRAERMLWMDARRRSLD